MKKGRIAFHADLGWSSFRISRGSRLFDCRNNSLHDGYLSSAIRSTAAIQAFLGPAMTWANIEVVSSLAFRPLYETPVLRSCSKELARRMTSMYLEISVENGGSWSGGNGMWRTSLQSRNRGSSRMRPFERLYASSILSLTWRKFWGGAACSPARSSRAVTLLSGQPLLGRWRRRYFQSVREIRCPWTSPKTLVSNIGVGRNWSRLLTVGRRFASRPRCDEPRFLPGLNSHGALNPWRLEGLFPPWDQQQHKRRLADQRRAPWTERSALSISKYRRNVDAIRSRIRSALEKLLWSSRLPPTNLPTKPCQFATIARGCRKWQETPKIGNLLYSCPFAPFLPLAAPVGRKTYKQSDAGATSAMRTCSCKW